jgi:hypothetical protein
VITNGKAAAAAIGIPDWRPKVFQFSTATKRIPPKVQETYPVVPHKPNPNLNPSPKWQVTTVVNLLTVL